MLRITVHDSPEQLVLKLEGKLAGVWVTELEDCWRGAASSAGGRPLQVDLSDVDGVDAAGKYLLVLMSKAGARLVAPGSVMSQLVEEVTAAWPDLFPMHPETNGKNQKGRQAEREGR
jgi:hypothetical protein